MTSCSRGRVAWSTCSTPLARRHGGAGDSPTGGPPAPRREDHAGHGAAGPSDVCRVPRTSGRCGSGSSVRFGTVGHVTFWMPSPRHPPSNRPIGQSPLRYRRRHGVLRSSAPLHRSGPPRRGRSSCRRWIDAGRPADLRGRHRAHPRHRPRDRPDEFRSLSPRSRSGSTVPSLSRPSPPSCPSPTRLPCSSMR